jgi:hypothetical protein
MSTKGVKKREVSQAVPSLEGSKVSSPKDKIAPSEGGAPGAKTTRRPRTVKGHVPNDETAQVLREAQEGKNLLRYENLEEMFKDLGI